MVFFNFVQILIEHTVNSVASDLDLHCLPLSHKKDAVLKWIKDRWRMKTVRVKSGIFEQKAKSGQRPCLFHISNIGIKIN